MTALEAKEVNIHIVGVTFETQKLEHETGIEE